MGIININTAALVVPCLHLHDSHPLIRVQQLSLLLVLARQFFFSHYEDTSEKRGDTPKSYRSPEEQYESTNKLPNAQELQGQKLSSEK